MKKYSNETIVGIFVVLGLAAISFMAVRIGNISIAGDNSYSLYAPFSTVSGLRVGNAVEMMGMEIGRVAGAEVWASGTGTSTSAGMPGPSA